MRVRLAIVCYYTQDGDVGITLCAQHARNFRPAKDVERMDARGHGWYCDLCWEAAEEPVRV